MDILKIIAQDTGIPLAELKRIQREGKAARNELEKYGASEEQIRRGLLRILDATIGTTFTKDWQ